MTVRAIGAIERTQIHLANSIEHRPNQMILRHPLAQRRRHKKHLITTTANEVQSHDRRLPTRPDNTAPFPDSVRRRQQRPAPATPNDPSIESRREAALLDG
jgi:hypothetical protein